MRCTIRKAVWEVPGSIPVGNFSQFFSITWNGHSTKNDFLIVSSIRMRWIRFGLGKITPHPCEKVDYLLIINQNKTRFHWRDNWKNVLYRMAIPGDGKKIEKNSRPGLNPRPPTPLYESYIAQCARPSVSMSGSEDSHSLKNASGGLSDLCKFRWINSHSLLCTRDGPRLYAPPFCTKLYALPCYWMIDWMIDVRWLQLFTFSSWKTILLAEFNFLSYWGLVLRTWVG